MAVAAASHDKALNWINTGNCVILDNDDLDQLGHTLEIDWVTEADGERKPTPFNKEVMDRFLSRFVRVDAFTLRKTDSVWTEKFILVSPSLMTGDTFQADETTLSKATLVAKRVFERVAPNKYEIVGSPQFMRNPTVLSGAVAELKIREGDDFNVLKHPSGGVRFLDFKQV
jgi:hypothetical protein